MEDSTEDLIGLLVSLDKVGKKQRSENENLFLHTFKCQNVKMTYYNVFFLTATFAKRLAQEFPTWQVLQLAYAHQLSFFQNVNVSVYLLS